MVDQSSLTQKHLPVWIQTLSRHSPNQWCQFQQKCVYASGAPAAHTFKTIFSFFAINTSKLGLYHSYESWNSVSERSHRLDILLCLCVYVRSWVYHEKCHDDIFEGHCRGEFHVGGIWLCFLWANTSKHQATKINSTVFIQHSFSIFVFRQHNTNLLLASSFSGWLVMKRE